MLGAGAGVGVTMLRWGLAAPNIGHICVLCLPGGKAKLDLSRAKAGVGGQGEQVRLTWVPLNPVPQAPGAGPGHGLDVMQTRWKVWILHLVRREVGETKSLSFLHKMRQLCVPCGSPGIASCNVMAGGRSALAGGPPGRSGVWIVQSGPASSCVHRVCLLLTTCCHPPRVGGSS